MTFEGPVQSKLFYDSIIVGAGRLLWGPSKAGFSPEPTSQGPLASPHSTSGLPHQASKLTFLRKLRRHQHCQAMASPDPVASSACSETADTKNRMIEMALTGLHKLIHLSSHWWNRTHRTHADQPHLLLKRAALFNSSTPVRSLQSRALCPLPGCMASVPCKAQSRSHPVEATAGKSFAENLQSVQSPKEISQYRL